MSAQIVYVVEVESRFDGIYLFATEEDAVRFAQAVIETGGNAEVGPTPISEAGTVEELIAQELES